MRMDVLPALLVVLAAAAPVSAVDLPAPASADHATPLVSRVAIAVALFRIAPKTSPPSALV